MIEFIKKLFCKHQFNKTTIQVDQFDKNKEFVGRYYKIIFDYQQCGVVRKVSTR